MEPRMLGGHQIQSYIPQIYLKPPDMLAFLGDVLHCLAHQGNQHVEEEDKGEDDIGDEQQEEQKPVLGILMDLQLAQA